MFDSKSFIELSLKESSETKLKMLATCNEDIINACNILTESLKNGGKILLCGNGGSAADCQHIATEFMVRLSRDIKRPPIPAIALTTDTSNLTAGGNDIGFQNVFARSIEGLGQDGDVLIAISTSGTSENIIKAIEKAKSKKMQIISFSGGSAGKLKSMSDVTVVIPSNNVQRIQEGHITVGHIVCEIVERNLYT
jgi:D-sedoheptulose 7-phosphate isomerase